VRAAAWLCLAYQSCPCTFIYRHGKLSADPVFIASPSNLSVLSLKNPMKTAPRQFIPSTLLTYLKSPWSRLPRQRKILKIRHQTCTKGHPPCTAPSRRCTHPERLKISTPMTTPKSRQSKQRHPCHKYRSNTLNQKANYQCRANQCRKLASSRLKKRKILSGTTTPANQQPVKMAKKQR